MRKEFRNKVKALCFTLIMCTIGTFFTGCGGNSPVNIADLQRDLKENAISADGELSQNSPVKAADLLGELKENAVNANGELSQSGSVAIMDFAVRLFRECEPAKDNTLASPLSVICALAMTAGGAQGETLEQMEESFGLSISELREYLYSYINQLPAGDKYRLHLANSIWIKEDKSLTVKNEFLQTNKDYFDAEIYQAPFDDTTVKDINTWVKENTEGRIKDILNEIPDEAVMYLVNALAFDAQWQKVYNDYQVRDGKFITEAGEERDTTLMYGTDHAYLEEENAAGFIKYYADGKYAFAALVPEEGLAMEDYLAALTGDRLLRTLENVQEIQVDTAIPKFECEYSINLKEVLQGMGMEDAFHPELADFTGIGEYAGGNLYISRVIHKTYLSVDEKGTEAGAATMVEVREESMPLETRTVTLNRPFLYMLIDCETNFPFFIGTVMDIKNS